MSRCEERQRGTARRTRLHEDDGSFDREFWSAVTPERRLALVWEMALESWNWRRPAPLERRLQRSVCRIQRGRG